ncbi:MAG: DEAD/DEAH box helicase [Clostridium sp.]|uniref:DEAD/DEAH box helicase n=1 Tax=Clostridium sp. TaxID=1506 RepID=UPI003D6D7534
MNRNARMINNALNLRDPQTESLEIFETICDTLQLKKEVDLKNELEKIKALFPTLSDFERSFPSVCFSLATGIGKTRLMGAFIAYLYYEKGFKNFFVMAPNLTIYNKLKSDFSNSGSTKYVFKGLDAFVSPPRIIDGDNYGNVTQTSNINNDVIINIFNIAKLNSESKTNDGKPARIKRLNEILGESYFDYLVGIDDLCILMDESHHYHADKSFDVINELKPILGIEVTATPQIQKGATTIKFKNVVYEYSLAHALKDEKYIKVPNVATRKDFNPDQYKSDPWELDRIKLKDGITAHILTQAALEVYARTTNKPVVKPFVLVVAKDTDHSKQIFEYVISNSFMSEAYKNKVIEINSSQKGAEKDGNIAQLLSLESIDNKIEIVIHVNMLKEGWDVNNLYTIIPLRTSASDTLTEQTIGRGLRLPYGERTGNLEVDRLTIVSHDKYEAIIKIAEDPNSLVRRFYFIDPNENESDDQIETMELSSKINDFIYGESFAEQMSIYITDDAKVDKDEKKEVVKFISHTAYKTVLEVNKTIKNINEVKDEAIQKMMINSVLGLTQQKFPQLKLTAEDIAKCVQKTVEQVSQVLTDIIIPIPQAIVQPIVEVVQGFNKFDLDIRFINYQPSIDDKLMITELKEDGKTIYSDMSFINAKEIDLPENAILKHLMLKDNIDYVTYADFIYELIEQLKEHLMSYLKDEEKVKKALVQFRTQIVETIYAQMNEHFYKEETNYKTADMRPFCEIIPSFGGKYITDDIYDYRSTIAGEKVKSKIFKGFTKSCHTLYKFKNNTEKTFAMILERNNEPQRWLCPSRNQFNIYYDKHSDSRYQPDFIVETKNCIYMVETKDVRNLNDPVVVKKAKAATEYCRAATEFNKKHGGKQWRYALISHENVRLSNGFDFIMKNRYKFDGEVVMNNERNIKIF